MKQCYVTGYEAEGAQVNVAYDSEEVNIKMMRKIHWRLEDSWTDVKWEKTEHFGVEGLFSGASQSLIHLLNGLVNLIHGPTTPKIHLVWKMTVTKFQ